MYMERIISDYRKPRSALRWGQGHFRDFLRVMVDTTPLKENRDFSPVFKGQDSISVREDMF